VAKVRGLFLDYDGTISQLSILRQISKVSSRLETVLYAIRMFIPVAIISMKDMHFILPRTPFASAWAAMAGLETKIGTQLCTTKEKDGLFFLTQSLNYAKRNLREGAVIEEKRDSSGQTLAFCVDWRMMHNKRDAEDMALEISGYCRSNPLAVIEYKGKPYFDVFPHDIDKGQTIKELKEKLGLSDGIIYMGDSITDNPAFKVADISIGVTEGKKPVDLVCKYWINFADIASFLSDLYKNNLIFRPDLQGLKIMEQANQSGD
jgi:trehalose-phosphatase